ncbi:hypothetical protein [Candidatus Nanohalococcus occultus]|uniref:hypothetical protein n=1 Tax=Candidatus Nanohalococcus occultus TaxID=2978047 RepID=UPI00325FD3DE
MKRYKYYSFLAAFLSILGLGAAQTDWRGPSASSLDPVGFLLGLWSGFTQGIGNFSDPSYLAGFVVIWGFVYASIAIFVNIVAQRGPWSFNHVVEFLMADSSTSPPARGSISPKNGVLVLTALSLITLLGGPLDFLVGNVYWSMAIFGGFLALSFLVGTLLMGPSIVFGLFSFGAQGLASTSNYAASSYMDLRNSPVGRFFDRAADGLPGIDGVNQQWNDFLESQGYQPCYNCGNLNDGSATNCSNCGDPLP